MKQYNKYYFVNLDNEIDSYELENVDNHPLINKPVLYIIEGHMGGVIKYDKYKILFTDINEMLNYYTHIEEYELCEKIYKEYFVKSK